MIFAPTTGAQETFVGVGECCNQKVSDIGAREAARPGCRSQFAPYDFANGIERDGSCRRALGPAESVGHGEERDVAMQLFRAPTVFVVPLDSADIGGYRDFHETGPSQVLAAGRWQNFA